MAEIAAAAVHRIAVQATAAAMEVWSARIPALQGPTVCPIANAVVKAANVGRRRAEVPPR